MLTASQNSAPFYLINFIQFSSIFHDSIASINNIPYFLKYLFPSIRESRGGCLAG